VNVLAGPVNVGQADHLALAKALGSDNLTTVWRGTGFLKKLHAKRLQVPHLSFERR
jgi:hypothetical protein